MAYNNFTTEKLFTDESINILCNRIYTLIINEYGETIANDNFCLTGSPAKIVQGDPKALIKVVPFITDSEAIFELIPKIASYLKVTGAIAFTDRIQIVFDNVYFEIWYTETMGTINTVSNLRVHNPADIPAYIN